MGIINDAINVERGGAVEFVDGRGDRDCGETVPPSSASPASTHTGPRNSGGSGGGIQVNRERGGGATSATGTDTGSIPTYVVYRPVILLEDAEG